MSTADKLGYLRTTKELIKNEINLKGVGVDDTTPFREYSVKISAIASSEIVYYNTYRKKIKLTGKLRTGFDGHRYLTNSVGEDIVSISGQGLKLNSSQSVTVSINQTVNTVVSCINGEYSYDESNSNIDDYIISGVGRHGIYLFYDDLLTDDEKLFLETNPEKFIYTVSGVITTDSTIDTSKIVAYIPNNDIGNTAKEYISGSDLSISNYTDYCRTSARGLSYGLQNIAFSSGIEFKEGLNTGNLTVKQYIDRINQITPKGTVDITDFGAVGDGVTDTYDAWNTASASNSNIYFPDGTFYFDSNVCRLRAITKKVYGTGELTKSTNVYGGVIAYTANEKPIDVVIDKLQITNGVYLNGTSCENLTLQYCLLTSTDEQDTLDAFSLIAQDGNTVNGVNIIGNTFYNVARAPIEILNRNGTQYTSDVLQNILIDKNVFKFDEGAHRSADNFNYAISFSDVIWNTKITNNILDGYDTFVELSKDTVVENNRCKNVRKFFSAGFRWDNISIRYNYVDLRRWSTDAEASDIQYVGSHDISDPVKNFTYEYNTTIGRLNEFKWIDGANINNNYFINNDDSDTSLLNINACRNINFLDNYIECTQSTIHTILRAFEEYTDSTAIIGDTKLYIPNNSASTDVLLTNGATPTEYNNARIDTPYNPDLYKEKDYRAPYAISEIGDTENIFIDAGFKQQLNADGTLSDKTIMDGDFYLFNVSQITGSSIAWLSEYTIRGNK